MGKKCEGEKGGGDDGPKLKNGCQKDENRGQYT